VIRFSRERARFEDPALLLRRHPYGESSLVLQVLTPSRGRTSVLAKGAYRPSSGYFAVFDFFDTLELRWTAREGQDLGLVSGASLRTRRCSLSADLTRYRTALGLLELALATAREEHEERALFAWLEQWLDVLAAGRASPGTSAVAAGLSLLRANGLAPSFLSCAACGRRVPEQRRRILFSIPRGGSLCDPCAALERARAGDLESMSLNVARIAASLMDSTPGMLARTHLDANRTRPLIECVVRLLEYHLELPLRRSWSYLVP
jgi:DNA repair protein RecO (recombination protein O)